MKKRNLLKLTEKKNIVSDDMWTFCFLLVHARAQMEEITVKFTQLNWNRIVRLCTSFFFFLFPFFFKGHLNGEGEL